MARPLLYADYYDGKELTAGAKRLCREVKGGRFRKWSIVLSRPVELSVKCSRATIVGTLPARRDIGVVGEKRPIKVDVQHVIRSSRR